MSSLENQSEQCDGKESEYSAFVPDAEEVQRVKWDARLQMVQKALSEGSLEERNRALQDNVYQFVVQQFDQGKTKAVVGYLPFPSELLAKTFLNGDTEDKRAVMAIEPHIVNVFSRLVSEGKEVFIPQIVGEPPRAKGDKLQSMYFHLIEDPSELDYEVLSQRSTDIIVDGHRSRGHVIIENHGASLVLAPVISWCSGTHSLIQLGNGGGGYDKFIPYARMRIPGLQFVGLGYDFQRANTPFDSKKDAFVDAMITDSGLYRHANTGMEHTVLVSDRASVATPS